MNESPFFSFRKYLIITRKLIVNITKPNTKITTPAQKYKFPSLPRLTPIPLLVPVTSTTPMENQAGDITPRIAIHIRAIKVRNPRFEKVHIEKPSFFIFLYFMVAVYCHSFSLLLKRVMIMEKKRQKMWAASAMLTVNAPRALMFCTVLWVSVRFRATESRSCMVPMRHSSHSRCRPRYKSQPSEPAWGKYPR